MLQHDFWRETFMSNITCTNLGLLIGLMVRELGVSVQYIIPENISFPYQLSWLICKGVITFNLLLKMYFIFVMP